MISVAPLIFAALTGSSANPTVPTVNPIVERVDIELSQCIKEQDNKGEAQYPCIYAGAMACLGGPASNEERAECVSLERYFWDRKLNRLYKTMTSKKSPSSFSKDLRDAQRNWISLRDKDCSLFASMGVQGSREKRLHEECMLEHTAFRYIKLDEFYQASKGRK
ncbi:lysozyme inhibitor LprI family protein [Pseudovibrio flavus]|uniref:lysozyme inhibitor LprI family protein n=1 Tax=Pseudovibrio flavus TaxID=2529854 RepID=UPI00211C17DB|nr:lysozyme inhibitor LprI family protein [Pseudovibrio flavus]